MTTPSSPPQLIRGIHNNNNTSSEDDISYSNYAPPMSPPRSKQLRNDGPVSKSERARVAATPTVDNRKNINNNNSNNNNTYVSPYASPTKAFKNNSSSTYSPKSTIPEKTIPQDQHPSITPKDRKTKIQVCIRVRPILPSDEKNLSRSSSPASMSADQQRGRKRTIVKATSNRHMKITPPTSPPSSPMKRSLQSSSQTSPRSRSRSPSITSRTDIVDTEPAWRVHNNNISQSPHTYPDSTRTNDYTFDNSFGPNHTTMDIYQNSVKDCVISTMEGYHASVFAYGQTATGKTYTMSGSKGFKHMNVNDDSTKGIIQLSVEECFNYIYNQKLEAREYLLRVSFMEIYNEVINDLLVAPVKAAPIMQTVFNSNHHVIPPAAPSNIRIFESKDEGVIIRGLKEEIVTEPEQVYALLAEGEKRRQTGSTMSNKQSSRSHCVFRLTVESRKRISRSSGSDIHMSDSASVAESIASSTFAPASSAGPVRVSTLSLVDLAGSESIKNTGSTGTRQKEGQYINKSLLTLGHVVYKLAELSSKRGMGIDTTHIPYRDSKLTRLLQPSLSGNAQICMICNISPLARHIEESHLTLKFAARAKKIKQHATITEVVDEKTLLENYREEIEELKRQLKEAREQQQMLPGTTDEEDAVVISQAITNLERLILKTSTAAEKRKQQKRRERLAAARKEEGGTLNNLEEFNKSMGIDTVLKMLDDDATTDNLSAKNLLPSDKAGINRKSSDDASTDGLLSLDDESTVYEGKKLVTELHRIRGLLGDVLERKSSYGMKRTGSSLSKSDQEVERLRAQLHEQAVTTSLRQADSTFLQSQLQEKDALLKDVSQILEAVEKRQMELEAENGTLKKEYSESLSALKEKESEVIILEKLVKKREMELYDLKKKSNRK